MAPGDLSGQLRRASGNYLRQRRAVVGLSLAAIGSLAPVALYQMGLIKHLPEPPLPGFDADKVDAAPEAYALLATPDAVLGIVSYAVTMMLAAMGGQDRASEQPWLPIAVAGKMALDLFSAGRLTADQWTKHRAFCFWCLLTSGATFASAPFVIPEARAALRRLATGH